LKDGNIVIQKNKLNLINSKHTNVINSKSPERQEEVDNFEDEYNYDHSCSSKSNTSNEKDEIPFENLFSDDDKDEPKPAEKVKISNVYVPEKPFVPSSPVLQPNEKKEAREFGYSMDAKLLKDEFFFIDLEKMWFCLAISIQRHIHFSRGFLFLDDLARFLKTGKWEDKILDWEDLSQSENELRFSYWFPDQLKLNNGINEGINEDKRVRLSEETSNIQKAIGEQSSKWIFPSINTRNSFVKINTKNHQEVQLNEDLKYRSNPLVLKYLDFEQERRQSSKYWNLSRNIDEQNSSTINDDMGDDMDRVPDFGVNISNRNNKNEEGNDLFYICTISCNFYFRKSSKVI